ncbi:MAG: OsmC family protein [Pyrinomonadaceae bacterium]|nr:OsmC family protein [Pyrinomonadaceae bacterium]
MESNYKTVITHIGNGQFVGTSPSGHSQVVDTKSLNKTAASPVELLLIAVGSCTAIDVVSILEKKREIITDYRVEVTGERRDEFPRHFTKMHVHHIVYGNNVSETAVARAIELSDTKYCTVAATVRPTVEMTTSFEIIEVPDKK